MTTHTHPEIGDSEHRLRGEIYTTKHGLEVKVSSLEVKLDRIITRIEDLGGR